MTTTTEPTTGVLPARPLPVPGGSGRHAAPPAPTAAPPPGRAARLLRGRDGDPRWARPALLTLLVGTALLYLWGLGASGTANSFYAAAVQAGTQSWKALLFGSLDAGNFITVDKPPASLWIMGLSGRLFGFSSWSMLAPQALMGVASVGLLHAAVRRWAGPGAGLLAGTALALTPVAVLMFRFNNPDALLVLSMVAAAYAVVRAVDAAGDVRSPRSATWWMVAAGTLLGLGFLTKMMQAFLVLPALGAVFLLAADTPLRHRLVALAAGVGALVVSVGWYVLLVDLWPTDSRPYIGGSTDNSFMDLVLGYNGLGRILGGSGNGGGGGGGTGAGANGGFGGSAGIGRMFNSAFGGQISWLLPAALIVLVGGLWLTRRAPRTDRVRAGLVLWGAWTIVTALVFSFMSGTIHPYYAVALAPGIAGTLAVGGRALWERRELLTARLTAAVGLAVTTGWSVVLLRRTPDFLPWLRWVVLVAGVLAVVALLVPAGMRRGLGRRALPVVLLGALLAGAGGSVAYAAQTVATTHSGSIVSAGPSTGSDGGGGPGGGTGAAGAGGPGGARPSGQTPPAGAPTGGTAPTGTAPTGTAPTGTATTGGAGQGGPGETATSAPLTALLTSAGTRWSAATATSQGAASLELASGTAVMGIGGWSGSDAAPTLAQFQAYVAAGDVHYFVASGSGGAGGGPGGGGTSTEIATWVAAHFTATTLGQTTVYDLTAPTG